MTRFTINDTTYEVRYVSTDVDITSTKYDLYANGTLVTNVKELARTVPGFVSALVKATR